MGCPAIRDGIPGPANLSPEGCYKFTTGGNRPTCDVIESISQKSLCYCEDGRTGAIALMESTETNNVAECVHDDQTWMQDTYIAASVSAEISTGYLDQLLSPLATFGEFLSGLIPGSNVTNGTAPNPVNDVEGLMLAARTYLKIPLSGPAHFILQFEASIEIKCDFINSLREWAGDVWEHLPGTQAINAFCNMAVPTLGVTFSIGFQGFAIDEVNSYLEFNDGDHKHKIDFDIFPTCPPPVLTGGSCVWNSDCMASNRDPEATSCSAYDGYCLNNPAWKTARGCFGTCIDKLPNGADCSGAALNLSPLSLARAMYGGDDNACQSGRCSTDLICEPKLSNDSSCGEDDDCVSGRCASDFICRSKVAEGGGCAEDDDCMSGGCSWAMTCGTVCTRDSECSTGRCSRRLICEPKLSNDSSCGEDDDCVSGRCASDFICRSKVAEGGGCAEDDDCVSGRCSWRYL